MSDNPKELPFEARRCPFFYGWAIVFLGALGFLMSAPGQTYGVSPFTDSLIAALGLTRVQLSTAYMIGTIASSLLLTPAGRLYDRLGARVVASLAAVLLGVVLVVLSRCDYVARGVSSVLTGVPESTVAFVVLSGCFFLLRFSGQGVLAMASRNMVMKWFDRHRGLVAGISGMLIAPCFSATPALLNALVEALGWRQAWIVLAAAVGVGFSVVAAIFFRDNPEQCGLAPDGPLAGWRTRKTTTEKARRQFTLPEARRTYAFWVFAVSIALFGLYITGLSFHVASVFETAGLPRGSAFRIFLPSAVIAVILRPFVGWSCDNVPLKYLLFGMLGGIMLSCVGIHLLGGGHALWVIIAGNGLCSATIGSLGSVTWPTFYGRDNLGSIAGFSMSITVFASAIGPWVFGKAMAVTGSYSPAATTCMVAAVLLAIAAIRADNPQDAIQA